MLIYQMVDAYQITEKTKFTDRLTMIPDMARYGSEKTTGRNSQRHEAERILSFSEVEAGLHCCSYELAAVDER
jgi:hypothetical protein